MKTQLTEQDLQRLNELLSLANEWKEPSLNCSQCGRAMPNFSLGTGNLSHMPITRCECGSTSFRGLMPTGSTPIYDAKEALYRLAPQLIAAAKVGRATGANEKLEFEKWWGTHTYVDRQDASIGWIARSKLVPPPAASAQVNAHDALDAKCYRYLRVRVPSSDALRDDRSDIVITGISCRLYDKGNFVTSDYISGDALDQVIYSAILAAAPRSE